MKVIFVLLCIAVAVNARKYVPFDIVENVIDCGSAGILQFVAVEGCRTAPCNFTPGKSYAIDKVFIASRNAAQLTLKIKVLLDIGSEHLVASVPVEGRIVGGQQFTISFNLPITGDFAGRSMLVWFELIDEGDERLEICATASAHIAPIPPVDIITI